MKLHEVYELPDLPGYRSLVGTLVSGWHRHLPELEGVEHDLPYELPDDSPLQIRLHIDHNFDGERTMTMGSVWFESSPFMVFYHAGRSGHDDYNDWTTNWGIRGQAVAYILTLVKSREPEVKNDDTHMDVPEMYGQTAEFWLAHKVR